MKTLIVYYSLEGNTKYVAEKIAEQTGADLLCLEPEKVYPTGKVTKYLWGGKGAVMGDTPELKPYTADLSEYEMIVFGTPVWASTFTPPLRTFIKKHKDELKSKKIALFACSAGGSAEKCFANLQEELGCGEIAATLRLTDPAQRQREQNHSEIESFCKKMM